MCACDLAGEIGCQGAQWCDLQGHFVGQDRVEEEEEGQGEKKRDE